MIVDTFRENAPTPAELNGDITRQPPNHEEALQLAYVRGPNSNLARCYLDLVTRIRAVSPGLVNVLAHAAETDNRPQVNARKAEWAGLMRVLRYAAPVSEPGHNPQ